MRHWSAATCLLRLGKFSYSNRLGVHGYGGDLIGPAQYAPCPSGPVRAIYKICHSDVTLGMLHLRETPSVHKRFTYIFSARAITLAAAACGAAPATAQTYPARSNDCAVSGWRNDRRCGARDAERTFEGPRADGQHRQ